MHKRIAGTCILTTFLSINILADELIRTTDDRRSPIQARVFVDGNAVTITNTEGEAFLSSEECGIGSAVTAQAITDRASYLVPSSEGYCINSGDPVLIVLIRRQVSNNLQYWIQHGSDTNNWGIVAHSANELYGLNRYTLRNIEEATKYIKPTLDAAARVIGADEQVEVIFDNDRMIHIMSDSYKTKLVSWKREQGITNPTGRLDNQFFNAASKIEASDLWYQTPNQ